MAAIASIDRTKLSGTSVAAVHNKDFIDKIDALIVRVNTLSGDDAAVDIADVTGLTAALAAKAALDGDAVLGNVLEADASGNGVDSGVPTASLKDQGIVGTAVFAPADNPTDADTITIGSTVFEFDDDASITGDVTVTIGLDLAATMTELASQINGASENVKATAVGDTCKIQVADAPDGNLVAGAFGTLENSEAGDALTIIDGADASVLKRSVCKIDVTTAMLDQTTIVTAPFTVGFVQAYSIDSSGQEKAVDIGVAISGQEVTVDMDAGDNDLANGDDLYLILTEARS